MAGPPDGFRALTAAFLEEYFQAQPSSATQLGVHRYDRAFEDYSRGAIDARTRQLSGWLGRIGAWDRTTLDTDQANELRLMEAQVRAQLLHQNGLREWQQDPTSYITTVGNGLHSLIARNFAPVSERFLAATDRLAQVPALLDQARANLDRPARITTEAAIEQLGDTMELFEQELPRAFAGAGETRLAERFQTVNEAAVRALRSFGDFLQSDVLLRSDGDFAVGAQHMRDMLKYEDWVDRPLEELVALGRRELLKTQEQVAEVAARLDPHRSLSELVEAINKDHPSAKDVVPEAAALLAELRSFCLERDLVTLAAETPIQVEVSPSFMRFFGFAYCDSPGPFEEVATEAYFYLTPPDALWPAEQTEAYLSFFNRSFLPIIALHETYPGHYVHLPWQRKAPGAIARAFWSTATVEGWGHYCEEMMLDEGYRAGDLKVRLAQLQAALLRLCRYLVALQIHTGALTYDEAVEFYVREGHTERVVAEREVRRGALNPTFYAYTLGKLEILRLREEYRVRMGSQFRLKDFHNRIVQTPLPLPLVRQHLLGPSRSPAP